MGIDKSDPIHNFLSEVNQAFLEKTEQEKREFLIKCKELLE